MHACFIPTTLTAFLAAHQVSLNAALSALSASTSLVSGMKVVWMLVHKVKQKAACAVLQLLCSEPKQLGQP
eukprot:scaffold273205_cov26-Tisochrysis_lutea.AAC.2